MTDDHHPLDVGTERVLSARASDEIDRLVAFEEQLLRAARLRAADGSAKPATRGFRVRIEDLLSATGRRGAPRR